MRGRSASLSASEAMCSRGSQQYVHRGLGIDVGKGVAQLVLIDGGGGNTSLNDLAKEATHNANSVQECFSQG